MMSQRARRVVVLGSTGSVGTQALDVVRNHRDRYEVVALAAGRNADLLEAQRREFGVEADRARVCADDPDALAELAALPDADVVLNAVVGFAGLPATIAALRSGKRLALANKESLIAAGPLVAKARADGGGEIVPVDSEHSAIWQSLRAGAMSEVARIVLTASGGPFRGRTRDELTAVTPEEALAHPTWAMGPVVTTNSATLVNKGLEVIEAHLLFGIGFDRIDVVVHPQSVVHSMVEFTDGSTLAQLSPPDMRLPIALGLAWPERVADAAPGCDWTRASTWQFEPLDDDAFPAVRLARRVGEAGGTLPAVYNAANEECVEAFLTGRLPFPAIVDTVSRVVDEAVAAAGPGGGPGNDLTLDDVLAAESWARGRAGAVLTQGGAR
jgi:1-deoxy-D-xylulose-5-phosphate reductoisomerase